MHDIDERNAEGADPAATALERLFEVAVVLDGAIDQGLGAQGLTRARAEVIWRLAHAGAMTQRELSDSLQCSPRNVTGLVDALEADGLATRRPHPSDRRATLVTLTDRGAEAADRWRSRYRDLGHRLFADLTTSDLRHLAASLEQILARLHDHVAGPGGSDAVA